MNELLLRRRNAVIKSNPSLPYDAEVEYLRNPIDNNCWIDTKIEGNVRIVGKAQELSIKGSSCVLLCSTLEGRGGTYFGEAVSTRKWGLGASTGQNVNIPPTTMAEFDITFNNKGASGMVNGLSLSRTVNINQRNWYIFSTGNISFLFPFQGDVYYIKMYQNDALVRDFIPVRVGQTGYLYDKVSGTLFGNDGTGSFGIGNDIT